MKISLRSSLPVTKKHRSAPSGHPEIPGGIGVRLIKRGIAPFPCDNTAFLQTKEFAVQLQQLKNLNMAK